MKRRWIWIISALIMIAIVGAIVAIALNLRASKPAPIGPSNGSFESPLVSEPYVKVQPDADPNALGGWKISDWPLDHVGSYWQAPDGKQSIHLGQNASISQDVATTPDQRYELSLFVAGN